MWFLSLVFAFAQPEIAGAAEAAGFVVGMVGLVKNVVELVQGNPHNIFVQQIGNSAENVLNVLGSRTARLAPLAGFAGNLYSLNFNLKPTFSIGFR